MNTDNISAVILCAGKGTRMNDNSKNKVCFECGGMPVIRRIVDNMRAAGVHRFVLVVGHQAQSVMDAMEGEEGIAYAYQAEQKGTGHAVQCGLKTLAALGFDGRAIVGMGDKVVSTSVIRGLVEESADAEALWGVQPLSVNPNGGRVIVSDGRPYGVVEKADVAYQALAGAEPSAWSGILSRMGLNEKKARKVMERARKKAPSGHVELNGRRFGVNELESTPYANAGLYCFNVRAVLDVLKNCGSDNAQGEIYLTDALEHFAKRGTAKLFQVSHVEDMLTFSTKPELRDMCRYFMNNASAMLLAVQQGEWNERLTNLYGADALAMQRKRYAALLLEFVKRYGDRVVILTRAPGRVNLMGRHIDHRGGNTNVMVIDRDTLMVVSPRNDDVVHASNMDAAYADGEFSIGEWLSLCPNAQEWLEYLENPVVAKALERERGSWINYIKSAVLRFQRFADFPVCGMDMLVTGDVPTGAGLSSSSSLVVATGEAVVSLNSLNLTAKQFVELCGEGEWLVGSRGGAGDHAAMKYGRKDYIVQLSFKPFEIGESYPFDDRYAVLVADSLEQAKKSEGSRDAFNARVAAYEFGFMLLRKRFAQRGWREFRELAELEPQNEIYGMLKTIPEFATRAELMELLPTQHERLKQIFASHADPGKYPLRAVVLYGASECVRARRFGSLLEKRDYHAVGEMMKISQDGDRIRDVRYTDKDLDEMIAADVDLALACGAYGCSTKRIDGLCDLLDSMDGVLGSSLVGAGLGGSVIALIERSKATAIVSRLGLEFYSKLGKENAARVYTPSAGSMTIF
ncbi:MAG: NTP transferase domain-containing protein [Lentisphaeria bacterium]|nr:NTP transferase domain-containing protein [Lentisphaeria bacterium]